MSYNLSVEDAKLLVRIHKKPGKTIYYYAGILMMPRSTLSNKVNILHDLGFIKRRSGGDRKYIYFVTRNVFEMANNVLNPNVEDDGVRNIAEEIEEIFDKEGDDDGEGNAGAEQL